MQAVFLILASLLARADLPVVVADIDTIAVCHVSDGAELIFFFDFVQGEWACLDHRWLARDMAAGRDGDRFTLCWCDDGDSCLRLMRACRWLETWERISPLAETHAKPWHARLCAPGLRQPTKRTN